MWAALIATIAFCVLPKSKAWCISLPPTAPRPRFGTRGSYLTMHRASVEDGADRRHFIGSTLAVPLSIVTLPSKTVASQPESKTGASSMVSPAEVARRLGAVPTFTVVDKRGVPFMVFGEDAKLTAYFFTTYDEASRILGIATSSSDKSLAALRKEVTEKRKAAGLKPLTKVDEVEEVGINPWKEARISSVPLDFAFTLSTKSGKQSGGSMYFRVAPSEGDVANALGLDESGKKDLAEGKVPIFYVEDFKVPKSEFASIQSSSLPDEVSPLFFRKSELLDMWKKMNPNIENPPQVKVSELNSIVMEMVRPGGTDEDLKSLVFVPPSESLKRRTECDKKGKKEQPFIIGERIVTY